jgi:membrane protease subunit HflK
MATGSARHTMIKRILIAVAALLLVAYLLTGVTMVRPGERAVVRRFGRVLPEKPSPGLFVGMPWGIDRIDRIEVDRVRTAKVGYRFESPDEMPSPPGQLLTGDHNLINIQIVLHYSVNDDAVEDYVVHRERVDEMIERLAESALAEWVAARTVDDVIVNAKLTLPAWIVEQMRARIRPYGLGIQIRDEASISYLFPPEDVRVAFDKVTKAQTEMRTQRYQAEQVAQQRLRDAEIARFKAVQDARAFAREQTLLAQGDAGRFERRRAQYEQLRRENPDFLAGVWWDSLGSLLGDLRLKGRIDLMDNHIGGDGLDILQFPPSSKNR